MELAEPIELLTSVRDSGGLVCAVAKTADGKGASVVWDGETKSWSFAKGLGVGEVFAADVAPADVLIDLGISSPKLSTSSDLA